jgi:hypothetical protein
MTAYKRPWIGATEAPMLVDVRDWTTDRLLFSVRVWPPLESSSRLAGYDHRERANQIVEVFTEGGAEKMWSTYREVDHHGLVWDHHREVWVDGEGVRCDGSRFGVGSRAPAGSAEVDE